MHISNTVKLLTAAIAFAIALPLAAEAQTAAPVTSAPTVTQGQAPAKTVKTPVAHKHVTHHTTRKVTATKTGAAKTQTVKSANTKS